VGRRDSGLPRNIMFHDNPSASRRPAIIWRHHVICAVIKSRMEHHLLRKLSKVLMVKIQIFAETNGEWWQYFYMD